MSLTTVRLREAWNFGGLTPRQLLALTYRQIDKHETLDRAAAVAFYAMLALVPFLGFLLTLALKFGSGAADQLLRVSAEFLPREASTIVGDQVNKVRQAAPVGIL